MIEAAAEFGKMIEINTTPKRLDLDWRHLKKAKSLGVKFSINPDAHRTSAFNTMPLGVMMARKGGLCASDVLNTRGVEEIEQYFKTRRAR